MIVPSRQCKVYAPFAAHKLKYTIMVINTMRLTHNSLAANTTTDVVPSLTTLS